MSLLLVVQPSSMQWQPNDVYANLKHTVVLWLTLSIYTRCFNTIQYPYSVMKAEGLLKIDGWHHDYHFCDFKSLLVMCVGGTTAYSPVAEAGSTSSLNQWLGW
jgi:hypothetical protein